MGTRLLLAWLVLVTPAAALAADEPVVMDTAYFLGELIDLDRLTRLDPGVVSAQFSSYDRASYWDAERGEMVGNDANGDAGHYLRVDPVTGEAVMADIEGPGVLVRFWSANPQGRIRIYLDGAAEPAIDLRHEDLYNGAIEPFVKPIVWRRGDNNPASNSYFPIPFAKSCRVAADAAHNQYYHIGYKTYPKNARIRTFRQPLNRRAQRMLNRVSAAWNNLGADPQPMDGLRRVRHILPIEPGVSRTVRLDGPGEIRELRAKIHSDEANIHRKLAFTIRWDGEATPSVNTPLGDFFGVSFGFPDYTSLPLGVVDGEGYCYWRMPFRESAVLRIHNNGLQPAEVELMVGMLSRIPAADAVPFKAKWRREINASVFDYPILEAKGAGNFVGCAIYVDNVHGGWWGEGDEKIWVDGEHFPSFFGTGSEDYFGDAWGIRHFENALHGCPQTTHRQQACYRWHVIDNVPYQKSFRMTMENYTWNDIVKNDYATIAYWYAATDATDFFEPIPPFGWMPLSNNVVAGASEAEGLKVLGGGAAAVEGDAYSMGRALRLPGPAGTVHRFNIPGKDATAWRIALGLAEGEVEATINGAALGERNRLKRGDNTLALKVASDDGAVFDFVKIDLYRKWVRDWLVVGPFPYASPADFDRVLPAESTVDRTATFDGIDGKVEWRAFHADANGRLDFRQAVSNRDDALALAAVDVISPDARRVRAYIGSDDGARVWLNGKAVYEHRERRAAVPDNDVFEVDLKPGVNTVRIKIWQGPGDWALLLRFDDPEDGLRYVLPE